MNINEIVQEVLKLVVVNRIQEIAIWHHDTDVLTLDGICQHYDWGCSLDQMCELSQTLYNLLNRAGYWVDFSGFNVSWECVRIILNRESEILKDFMETHPVDENSEDGKLRRKGRVCVKNPPRNHAEETKVGRVYFHR